MKTTKSEAKKEIQRLIEKYERVKTIRQLKQYDEANTRKDFIMPFFQALGWDVYSHFIDQEVVEEEEAVTGRVDYSFRINNIPQFLLEAKALSVNLDKAEWAKQSLTYGWNKGIPWVILTNFEKLKLFNSEWLQEIPHPNLEFTYDEYLKRIDDLWLFSKQSIETGELDQQASKWGIKAKRLRVSEKLAADLLKWRELLRKYFKQYNPKIDDSDIDESVQRVLDRLIFIRVCEDRQLESPTLWPALQRWIVHNRKPDNFMKALRPIFQDFDQKYNSNLFLRHLCERLDTEGTPFEKIINDLYADKEKGVKYNFSAIGADILGAIYEQYLGFVQLKGQINGAKRKKQGIYYTPSYIVDYIVQNTLGKVLKEKSLTEIENLKILDPACGSGSFLIKAFDLFDRTLVKRRSQEKFGPKAAFRKYNILRNNIYGVDLDQQAIEIARLNLLLKALEPKHKLPILSDNTKVGNSLISGSEKKLKNYFGENWKEKKPFNWQKEFPRVFKQGGFDIVVGNPPWISNDNLENADKSFYGSSFKTATSRYDIACLFVERALNLLKEGGYLGFVMPEHVWIGEYFTLFRKFLENYTTILRVVSLKEGIFQDVANPASLFICRKLPLKSRKQKILIGKSDTQNKIALEEFTGSIRGRIIFDSFMLPLIDKIKNLNYQSLGNFALVTDGIQTADLLKTIFTQKPEDKRHYFKALRSGKSISNRYGFVRWDGWWVLKPQYTRKLKRPGFSYDSPKRKKCFEVKEKIILRQTEPTIFATIETNGYLFPNSIFQIALEKHNHKKLMGFLAILNSKFLRFYYSKFSQVEGTTKPQIYLNLLKSLPIPRKISTELSRLSDRMLKLNRDFQKCAEDSDKYRAVQVEIKRIDEKIDNLVYKLYGLTLEEVKIVEKSKG